ncbi:MAG: 2-C-methyl-D-erythritol 4-phosphate cytidylyltransferase [Clostridia bacterium]|nr:2-C-methyl-D-erythritol 4-phosphate cytidylyltransferase [Clostridia bacterium]
MAIQVIQKIAEICDSITKKEKHQYTTAIILAAGKSERMQNEEVTKQMMELDGVPVIVRTMLAFESSKYIDEILVVATKEELTVYKTFKKKYNITKLKTAVEGGACRAESAAHGFARLPKQCKFVAIHDGARCLITTDDIDRVVKEAQRYGAAIAAKKATDTVKIADKFGFVKETPERASVWLAQTPQVFKKSLYEVSLIKAEKLNEKITDDAMLAENAGFHIKLVECRDENIKITTPEDVLTAARILDSRIQKQETL